MIVHLDEKDIKIAIANYLDELVYGISDMKINIEIVGEPLIVCHIDQGEEQND